MNKSTKFTVLLALKASLDYGTHTVVCDAVNNSGKPCTCYLKQVVEALDLVMNEEVK